MGIQSSFISMLRKWLDEVCFLKKSYGFFLDKRTEILFSVIISIINYTYFLTHEVKAPDAVYIGNNYMAGNWERSLGRFGLPVWSKIFGCVVNTNLNVFACIVFLTLSALIVIDLLRINSVLFRLIVCALFITSPQIMDTMMFIYTAPQYCFSILMGTISVRLMIQRKNVVHIMLSVMTIVISLSLYQAYFGYICSMIILVGISEYNDAIKLRNAFSEMSYRYAMCGIGVGTYYIILKIILKCNGVQLASYKGAGNVGIESIMCGLRESVLNTYADFINYFFYPRGIIQNDYLNRYVFNIIILICIVVIAALGVINNIKRFWIVALLLLFPFMANVIDIIAVSTRICLVTGFALQLYYLIPIVLLNDLSSLSNIAMGLIKTISISMTCMVLIVNIITDNISCMSRVDVFRNFYSTHQQMIARIEGKPGFSQEYKWCFNDVVRYNSPVAKYSNGFCAYDNETWKNYGGLEGTRRFYSQYFGKDIVLASEEEYRKAFDEGIFGSMTCYPQDGSIIIKDGIVYIKLNDNNLLAN